MVTVPGATAVTTPVGATVATPALLVVQSTPHPPAGAGDGEVTFADNVRVVPTAMYFEIGTETAIDVTLGFTVTTADADFPPALAVMVAEPGLSAVSVPDAETVTTVVSLDDQLVVHPPSGAAPTVVRVAVSAPRSPAVRVSAAGAMTTATKPRE